MDLRHKALHEAFRQLALKELSQRFPLVDFINGTVDPAMSNEDVELMLESLPSLISSGAARGLLERGQ